MKGILGVCFALVSFSAMVSGWKPTADRDWRGIARRE